MANNTNVDRKRWIVRGLAFLIGLSVLFAIGGLTAQQIAAAHSREKFPPPGQLVDVGGYRLHLNVIGVANGRPTIILENGGGGISPQWGWIQPALADYTRVVTWDRPGTGWSEASPHALDAVETIDALRMALAALGIEGPYILAGHSMGSLISRVYAEQYPAEVAGLVLIDPRPVDFSRVFPDGGEIPVGTFRMLSILNRLGITRLLQTVEPQVVGLPAQQYQEALALGYAPDFVSDSLTDGLMGMTSADIISDSQALGDLPILILNAPEGSPLSFMGETRQRLDAEHKAMLALSQSAQLRTIPGADHYTIVTHQEPAQQVAEAIIELTSAMTRVSQ